MLTLKNFTQTALDVFPPAPAKKLSALDAAAKVLGQKKKPMSAKELIEAMSAKGYWKSPGGKTPHATLYSAMLREINTKGHQEGGTRAVQHQQVTAPSPSCGVFWRNVGEWWQRIGGRCVF